MLNSMMLDVAVGLVFTFLAISLAVSAIVEAVASIMKWRSGTLLQGVKDLLNDQQFNRLARDLYRHALVNPRDDGTFQTEEALQHPPAYIHPEQFADAFIEIIRIAKPSPAQIKSAISNIRDYQLRSLVQGMFDRTAGDLRKMRQELARWFDNAMDRMSGAYKRRTQVWSFGVALIMAAGLNISAIDIGRTLWQEPIVAKAIQPSSNMTPFVALEYLQKLGNTGVPIGWTHANARVVFGSPRGIWTGLGWLITAFATLFGAPFWFDALQQIVRLKGTGPSPAEKISGSGAAA
jgi:hypothetical protein